MAEFADISEYKKGKILIDEPDGARLMAGEIVLFYKNNGRCGIHDPDMPKLDWAVSVEDVEEL